MSPDEDRTTAIGNMHKKFEDETSSSEDMIADRQTHTHTNRQTRSLDWGGDWRYLANTINPCATVLPTIGAKHGLVKMSASQRT